MFLQQTSIINCGLSVSVEGQVNKQLAKIKPETPFFSHSKVWGNKKKRTKWVKA